MLKLKNIEELPKTCMKRMWPHYAVRHGEDLLIYVNNTPYLLSDTVTIEMVRNRYKEFYHSTQFEKNRTKFESQNRTFYIQSSKKKTETYEVKQEGTNFSCNCRGYMFRRTCRHIDEVKNELNFK